MSQSTDPGELVRIFFDYVRQDIDVQRALVLNSAGLSAPQYRLVHDVARNERKGSAAATND